MQVQPKYEIAKGFCLVQSAIGWMLFFAGLVVLGIWGTATGLDWGKPGYLIAGGLALAGITMVGIAQFTQATIDTAENTAQMLALMRGPKPKR